MRRQSIRITKLKITTEADRLWKEQTTEEDRKTGWCGLHFIVKKRDIK